MKYQKREREGWINEVYSFTAKVTKIAAIRTENSERMTDPPRRHRRQR